MQKQKCGDNASTSSASKPEKKKSKIDEPGVDAGGLTRTISNKEKYENMDSPPSELAKDITKASLSLQIPIPQEDRKQVILSGGTDSLTVNDILQSAADEVKYIETFAKTNFPLLTHVQVHFRLENSLNIDRDVYDQVDKVAKSLMKFPARKFAIHYECMWIKGHEGAQESAKLAEWVIIAALFEKAASGEGGQKLEFMSKAVEDDIWRDEAAEL